MAYLKWLTFSAALFLLFSCHQPETGKENPTWNLHKTKVDLTLADSILFPDPFPEFISNLRLTKNALLYSFSLTDSTRQVVDSGLEKVDLSTFSKKRRMLGTNRLGQPMDIWGLTTYRDSIYTISITDRMIRVYDPEINLSHSIKFELPHDTMFIDNSLFRINAPDEFVVGIDLFEPSAYYNPVIRIDREGKTAFLQKELRLKFFETYRRDYSKVQYCLCDSGLIVIPQNEPFYYDIPLGKGVFSRSRLPDGIETEENPHTNELNNAAEIKSNNFQKNTAFLWSLCDRSGILLIQRIVDKSKAPPSTTYKIYSMNVRDRLLSVSDSLSWLPEFQFVQHMSHQDTLFLLKDQVLYKYVFTFRASPSEAEH